MKILQGSNGKIQFWVAGKISFSCLAAQNYRVMDDNEIHLISAGVKVLSIFASEITDIQVLGGAITPTTFNNSQELAESLDSNFFFEVSGADGNILQKLGSNTAEYNQGQTAVVNIISATAIAVGVQYFVPIELGGSYNEFSFIKNAPTTGSFNWAIYDTDSALLPTTRLWQSSEKVLVSASEELVQELIAPSLVLESKTYLLAYQGNALFRFDGVTTGWSMSGLSLSGTALSVVLRRQASLGYSSSFPATWVGALTNVVGGSSGPLMIFKKD